MTEKCPACDKDRLQAFFELDSVPVFCNVLWGTREEALSAARSRIQLGFCETCGMIYNMAFDPALVEYTPDYETSLHFSPRFQAYAEDLARDLVERLDLKDKDIIEIGCGKGEFLALICRAGRNRGLGFDASYDGVVDGKAGDAIRIIRDHYSEKYANHPADLICCRQVLEHIARPFDFLMQVRRAAEMAGKPRVFFEVPDGLWTLRDLGIWDIIYEHCSYFTAPSLRRVFERAGFDPRAPRSAFGGQYLCIEAQLGVGVLISPSVPKELAALRELVRRFSDHYKSKVARWDARLGELRRNGRRVAIWGAGSKGVTFLNCLRHGTEVEGVIDINPRKQGRFVAGTGQQVTGPQAVRELEVDSVLVMNPLYEAEVREQIARLGVTTEIESI